MLCEKVAFSDFISDLNKSIYITRPVLDWLLSFPLFLYLAGMRRVKIIDLELFSSISD